MDFWVWVQTVGAVFAGNLLFGLFAWGYYKVSQEERRGGDGYGQPARVYFAMAIPLMFAAAVVYSLH